MSDSYSEGRWKEDNEALLLDTPVKDNTTKLSEIFRDGVFSESRCSICGNNTECETIGGKPVCTICKSNDPSIPVTPPDFSQKVYSVTIPNLSSDSQHLIARECISLCRKLLEKNRKYGDSALKPMRAFSKASADEQLKVRLDDKLTRLINRAADEDEDVELDFIGYLILLRIWRQLQK